MAYAINEQIMQQVRKHYYAACKIYPQENIIGVFARGSMNYGVEYEYSDVDTRCIVVPTLQDIISNTPILNYTHYLPKQEHLEFRDIRIYIKNLIAQYLPDLEILFTPYCIINPQYKMLWQNLQQQKENIARINENQLITNILVDLVKDKNLAQSRRPSVLFVLNHVGYDPKQLYHILRLSEFGKRYMNNNETYESCLKTKCPEQLLYIKRMQQPILSKEEGLKLIEITVQEFKELVTTFKTKNQNVQTDKQQNTIKFLKQIQEQFIILSLSQQLQEYQKQ